MPLPPFWCPPVHSSAVACRPAARATSPASATLLPCYLPCCPAFHAMVCSRPPTARHPRPPLLIITHHAFIAGLIFCPLACAAARARRAPPAALPPPLLRPRQQGLSVTQPRSPMQPVQLTSGEGGTAIVQNQDACASGVPVPDSAHAMHLTLWASASAAHVAPVRAPTHACQAPEAGRQARSAACRPACCCAHLRTAAAAFYARVPFSPAHIHRHPTS